MERDPNEQLGSDAGPTEGARVHAARLDRRSLLKLMGASMAAALAAPGCVRKPHREVMSRELAPEHATPGVPLHYATTWTDGRFPYGMMVKTVEGRPIKIEGNSDHPVNRGSSSPAMQAALLSLYGPERLRAPLGATSWEAADERVRAALATARKGILMTRATLGPSERALVARFVERYPAVRHVVFEPCGDRLRRTAWAALFGRDGEWVPRFDHAAVIVSVGSDFLLGDGAELEAARMLGERRAEQSEAAAAAGRRAIRLYVIEGDVSLTGCNADHRIRLKSSAFAGLIEGLRRVLRGADPSALARAHELEPALLGALGQDLRSPLGPALVVAGPGQPAAVHAAVALLNDDLGAAGQTLSWNPAPPGLVPDDPAEVEQLLAGGVDLFIALGVNPVHGWPGGGFDALLRQARLSVGHGVLPDETVTACHLGLPSHHNLESWNDAEPRPGVTSLCQPVVGPLVGSRQEAVSLMTWLGMPADDHDGVALRPSFRALVRRRVETERLAPGVGRSVAWQQALQRGVVLHEAEPTLEPTLDRELAEAMASSPPASVESCGLELELRAHPGADDGRFGTNVWLLELPDPVTKVMWDNPLRLGPGTAAALGVGTGDVVAVRAGEARVELPVLVQPGLADGVLGADLGMGRRFEAGRVEAHPEWGVAGTVGVNTHGLLDGACPLRTGVEVERLGRAHPLAQSQLTFSTHGRPIVLSGTLDDLRADGELIASQRHRPKAPSLYPPYDYSKGPKWAMAIDLGRCTGCQACVVACQAENNIPVVGKAECANGREMHWLRIDLYRSDDVDDAETHFQPMLCQQCDNAPCENVCPVHAAAHSPDGLNEQVYNRCVGTRYCSNNCPYKVRRFNFYRYQERFVTDPLQKLMQNPNVTVRGIGVMEKCTFCIQRINAAKFRAANEGRPLGDGEVMPACAQACPARAIQFGDASPGRAGPPTEVVRWRQSARAFKVLEDLNVGPNVTYLARLRNRATASPAGTPEGQKGRG